MYSNLYVIPFRLKAAISLLSYLLSYLAIGLTTYPICLLATTLFIILLAITLFIITLLVITLCIILLATTLFIVTLLLWYYPSRGRPRGCHIHCYHIYHYPISIL